MEKEIIRISQVFLACCWMGLFIHWYCKEKKFRYLLAACFWLSLLLLWCSGCSTSFIREEITSTTGLTKFESGLWGYQKDLQNPDRAVRLSGCEGIAAREYYQLKAKGYDACIMAGYKMGTGHVQASILKKGVPLGLMSMQVTHILTEKEIWRIQK